MRFGGNRSALQSALKRALAGAKIRVVRDYRRTLSGIGQPRFWAENGGGGVEGYSGLNKNQLFSVFSLRADALPIVQAVGLGRATLSGWERRLLPTVQVAQELLFLVDEDCPLFKTLAFFTVRVFSDVRQALAADGPGDVKAERFCELAPKVDRRLGVLFLIPADLAARVALQEAAKYRLVKTREFSQMTDYKAPALPDIFLAEGFCVCETRLGRYPGAVRFFLFFLHFVLDYAQNMGIIATKD